MIVQRDTDIWLSTTEVPEVTYQDEQFDLDAPATALLGLMLGPPLKTVLDMQSGLCEITKRITVSVAIRRVAT
jgi:hypothetical protein